MVDGRHVVRVILVIGEPALDPGDRDVRLIQRLAEIGILAAIADIAFVEAADAQERLAAHREVERPEAAIIGTHLQPLRGRTTAIRVPFGDRGEAGIGPVARRSAARQIHHLAHQQAVERGGEAGVIGDQLRRRNTVHVEEHEHLALRRARCDVACHRERQRIGVDSDLADGKGRVGQVVERVLHHRDDQLGRPHRLL